MNNLSTVSTSWLAYLSAALLATVFVLVGMAPTLTAIGYVALAFHLIMFPVVAKLPAPTWGRAAGYGWLIVDTTLNGVEINGQADAQTAAFRLGAHLLLATWSISAAYQGAGVFRAVGFVAAILVGGYTLVAPYVPPSVFALAFVVVIVWIVFIGRRLSSLAPVPRSAAATA